MRPPHRDADAVRFNALWEAHSARVLAYATRHVGPDDAQEVVAETFLVAWRRLADVPGQPLPWLLVVARNTLANDRRSTYRRAVLHDDLVRLQASAAPAQAADITVDQRTEVLTALAAVSPKEREALLLITWDGLSVPEAARVAGCSTSAMHVRLFRARRRLHMAAADPEDDAGRAEPVAPASLTQQPRPPRLSETATRTRTAPPTRTARSPR